MEELQFLLDELKDDGSSSDSEDEQPTEAAPTEATPTEATPTEATPAEVTWDYATGDKKFLFVFYGEIKFVMSCTTYFHFRKWPRHVFFQFYKGSPID